MSENFQPSSLLKARQSPNPHQLKDGVLKKTAAMTDIHFGKSNNSETHNKDCLNFINWFCGEVRKDPTIDSVAFLGDWFDNRAAINVSTMNYSYEAAKLLNELGLPVYFIIGNHDLYHRHTREVYSTINFNSFENFIVVNDLMLCPEFYKTALFCPFLFHDEYPSLTQFVDCHSWWGHFEFKGFTITGYNMIMPTGPDHTNFNGPKQIFSGHFHKRQRNGNVCYIGNCFPHNYSDAGDNKRGLMVYDHVADSVQFTDWADCPKFQKIYLSDLLDGEVELLNAARVQCIGDVPIDYEESLIVRGELIETYNLREFVFKETDQLKTALSDTETDVELGEDEEPEEEGTLDELVIKMLRDVTADKLDPDVLIAQYMGLKL